MINSLDLSRTPILMPMPEISQTDRQGRSIFKAAPWLARCHPSGQIPRAPHGFYEAAHGIFLVDLNHEPQPSLDTITGNVATLTIRPPRRRWIAAICDYNDRKRTERHLSQNPDSYLLLPAF